MLSSECVSVQSRLSVRHEDAMVSLFAQAEAILAHFVKVETL